MHKLNCIYPKNATVELPIGTKLFLLNNNLSVFFFRIIIFFMLYKCCQIDDCDMNIEYQARYRNPFQCPVTCLLPPFIHCKSSIVSWSAIRRYICPLESHLILFGLRFRSFVHEIELSVALENTISAFFYMCHYTSIVFPR